MDARQQCRVARMVCWESLMNSLKSSNCEQLEAFLKQIPIQSRLGTGTAQVATNVVLRRGKCQSRSRIKTGPGRKWNGSYTILQSVWPKFKNPCKYPVFGTLQNPEKYGRNPVLKFRATVKSKRDKSTSIQPEGEDNHKEKDARSPTLITKGTGPSKKVMPVGQSGRALGKARGRANGS